MEQSPSDFSNKVVSFDKVDEDKKSSGKFKLVAKSLEALNIFTEYLSGISDEIVVTSSSGTLPLSSCIHANSNGIGAAAKLAI